MLRFQALTWSLQQKTPKTQWVRKQEKNGARLFRESAQVVHICGRTVDGESVRVAVLGHYPVFYADCSSDRFDVLKHRASYYDKTYEDWWVIQTTRVHKRVYQGFRNGETTEVLEITAANVNVARGLMSCLEHHAGCEIFNGKIDNMCAFFHRTGIAPCGWIDVNDSLDCDTPFDYSESRCDHDFIVTLEDICPVPESEGFSSRLAPFRVLALDIEACCPIGEDGLYPFPDATDPTHRISCICIRLREMADDENAEDIYFSFAAVDKATVSKICTEHGMHLSEKRSCAAKTEGEMLRAFVECFKESMPDIITGWNTLGFDMQYIFKRCQLHGISLSDFGKFATWKPKLRKGELSTAGAGHNAYEYWEIPGVFQMDELFAVRREMNLDSYSLNSCAEKFLGDTKIDEPPSEIHRKSQGTSYELAEIVGYCVKDSALADDIAKKLKTYIKLMLFANLARVPPGYLLVRGANIKTYSFIANEVHHRGMIISDKSKLFNALDGKYSGATVLDALSGFYRNDPVATLDFKSLYPSIIISQQLDPHTYVEDPRYLGLPGVEYKRFAWNDEKTNKRYNHVIVTNGAAIGCAPIVPDIMHRLWSERDATKKKMKQAKDPFEKSVYDGMQLAIKTLMNSIYGFFGAVNTNSMAHLPVAMLTTYMGRMLIAETQRFVLARFGSFPQDHADLVTLDDRLLKTQDELEELNDRTIGLSNVYGDSVADDTAMLLRCSGRIFITTFDELALSLQWETALRPGEFATGKEFASPTGLETWTDSGWTAVTTVMRHRTSKAMYRVTSHTGTVVVTSDHSLLTATGDKISPEACNVGDELLTSWPSDWPELETDPGLPVTLTPGFARILGMFVGDGSCGTYGSGINIKYTWAINNSDYAMLEQYKRLCDEANLNPGGTFIINDTLKSSGVYKLVPSGGGYGSVRKITELFRGLCYDSHRRKVVPQCILQAPREIRASFVGGFYDADGGKTDTAMNVLASVGVELLSPTTGTVSNMGPKFAQKGEAVSLGMYALARSLALKVNINTLASKPGIFWQSWSAKYLLSTDGRIKKIEPVVYGDDRYVYDLTTANHKFHAGVGQLITHNTDSVFIKWHIPAEVREDGDRAVLQYAFDLSERAAEETTDFLNRTMCPVKGRVELEFEKVYFPLILYTKKRYTGLMYTNVDKPDKLDAKGIQTVRRDNVPFLRDMLKKCLDMIMRDRDEAAAVVYMQSEMQRLLDGTYDIRELTLTKKLKPTPYKGTAPAHAEVAKKLRQRGLPIPDRVPFVFVECLDTKAAIQSERAEHPEYVKEHGLKLDMVYYVTHQIRTPLVDVLGPACPGLLDVVDSFLVKFRQAQRPAERAAEQKRMRMHSIESFFKAV